ncbi:hypothetical protein CHS0354_012166 [Potamilus streckersoni]|uniref:Uncharacterized protein n=1 Tax=Potamilus streckersoni TaxID=2493646 RepID=A0AAE0SAE9_9BIVA|nr:hypothetical protein CHS0354_012166 [Potamilus streckersoni]
MFGYTVAFIENGSGITSILVGAPNQTGVDGIKGYGGFYECEINSLRQGRGSCKKQDIVDKICQKFRTEYKCEDYQMLGATIAVNHKYQELKHNTNIPRVSVCAPGWKYILTEKYGNKFNFPVGKCYHFKETWQYESCENEYEYCIPFWKKPNEVDISMGGFSMKYSQDGKYSLIGGPGENQERGAVKSHQIKQEHIFDKRKDGLWVQYFGFSLTTANFNEYGSFTAGIPNYHPNQQGYTGRVEVFSVVDFARKNALNFGETTSVHFMSLITHYFSDDLLFFLKSFTKTILLPPSKFPI